MAIHTKGRLNRHPLALALTAVLAMPVGVASAQSNSAADDAPDQEQADESKKDSVVLDKITVTGSRIAKDAFTSVSPIQVITREETTLSGFNSTTGALQSNAVTGGSEQINNAFGGYVVDGGTGANTLSLRGLGATRTLILLNGRRVSPAGSRGSVGSADLNVLPNSMIDHIEILKDGASSIYGSDAVAGVVNIVTRKKVDGVTVEAQYNATQDGGGHERRVSIMGGTTGDRWHLSGSFEYYNRDELKIGDRGWASDCPRPLWGRDSATGEYGTEDWIDPATGLPGCWGLDAGGVTINTIGTPYALGIAGPGSLGYYGTFYPGVDVGLPPGFDYFNRWRPNGSITDGLPGFEGVDYYGRDTFDPDMLEEHIITPARTWTGFFQGGYDLQALGNAELYFEALLNRRKSSAPLYRQLSIDYTMGSPLIPAELQFPVRFLGPQPTTEGRNVGIRAFVGFGLTESEQQVDYFRFTGGLRGDLGAEWDYDFHVSSARSDAEYMIESFLTDRLAASMNVISDGNGGYICASPVARATGCVATPALNADTIGGNLPQAWRDYILAETIGHTVYTETTANLNLSGPLFEMPYGVAYGAFGIEHRKAKIDDRPDANSQSGNLFGLTASLPTYGTDSVSEAYMEIELPLLSGLTGAQELTVNMSGRYTDYDSYGDDTTYKIGMLYTPIESVSLRASYGTSYRAPALFEQYLGATSGFIGSNNDPCEDWGQLPESSLVRANCATEGLIPAFQQNSGIQVDTVGGAATGLAAETSKAITAGIVFQPSFPSGFGDLSFAADYFDIQVDNGVARLSGGEILNLCYGSIASDFNSDAGWCALVERDPNDNSLEVTTGYVNISTDIVRGWDFNTRYVRDIGPGSFRATLAVTKFLERSGRTFPTDPLVNFVGTLNTPEYTGSLDLSYSVKSWRVRYGLDWVDKTSSYDYYADGDADLRDEYYNFYDLDAPSYVLHNISVQYQGDTWTATGGVRNVMDKEPPSISNGVISTIGNAPLYSGYDYLGRTFFLNVSKTF